MSLAGMFAALTAVFSQIAIPMTPVPFSMGLFAVMLCGSVLTPKLAVASQLVYVLIGAAGAPVFAGFQGGAQRLVGPTGGFLIGYIVMSFVISLIASRRGSFPAVAAACLAGLAALYLFGAVWLGISMKLGLREALTAAVLPFIPLDLVKVFTAAAIGQRLRVLLGAVRS